MKTGNFFALCALALAIAPSGVRAAAGDVDPGFIPNPNNNMSGVIAQPDGAMVLAGNFSSVGGATRNFLARLSAGGAVDPNFVAGAAGGAGFTNPGVFCGAVQTDGKVVIGGLFAFVNGVARNFIARLNANGTLDTGYTASAGDQIRSIAIQPDGKIIVAGYFTSLNSVTRGRVARLLTDGTLDAGFDPNANAITRSVALQADGKIIFGGNFTTVGGVPRNHVARVNADGSVDMGFNPNVNGNVYSVAVQADGKVILGGTFTSAGVTPRNNIARVNDDGTLDLSFNPGADGNVRTTSIQADGRIVIGGEFTTAGGAARNRIARLNAGGSLDVTFNSSANAIVYGATVQADGRICLCGEFSSAGGAPRCNLARLLNDPATQSLAVTSPSRVEWLRGGSSPETHAVTLEISTDGDGTVWDEPVSGARIAGGWEFTGLSLPAGGHLRARARIAGGYNNGTAGLVESVTTFSISTPLQTWRQTYFGTPDNSGPAADNADPDKDGLENLVEFAFGLNPIVPDAAALPAWRRNENNLIVAFFRPPNVSGVTYLAETSTSLTPESWTPIPNIENPPDYFFSTPAGTGQRLYLRLRVTAP